MKFQRSFTAWARSLKLVSVLERFGGDRCFIHFGNLKLHHAKIAIDLICASVAARLSFTIPIENWALLTPGVLTIALKKNRRLQWAFDGLYETTFDECGSRNVECGRMESLRSVSLVK